MIPWQYWLSDVCLQQVTRLFRHMVESVGSESGPENWFWTQTRVGSLIRACRWGWGNVLTWVPDFSRRWRALAWGWSGQGPEGNSLCWAPGVCLCDPVRWVILTWFLSSCMRACDWQSDGSLSQGHSQICVTWNSPFSPMVRKPREPQVASFISKQ